MKRVQSEFNHFELSSAKGMAKDRRREEEGRGPGAEYQVFLLMESLLEKLKLLRYEELLSRHNMEPLSRNYFVSSPCLIAKPEEQFFMFSILSAWLLNKAGRSFTEPQEFDNPNITISNILAELKSIGVKVDFPPSKLKSGRGEHVCFVLNRLAEEALRMTGFTFKRPIYPIENTEEEELQGNDAELTLSQVEDDLVEEAEDEEENVMDLDALKLLSSHTEQESGLKPKEILESTVDASEWSLEVERVLPQLKATIQTNNKDWRIHVGQIHRHQDNINSSLQEAKVLLHKLQEDIGKNLDKVRSREKYINKQLEGLIQQYHSAQAQLREVKGHYQQAKQTVTEKTRVLFEINQELEMVNQEIEERSRSMSDGAPVVRIKQSVMKLKQEMQQMDVRIAVMEHSLLQAKLKEKRNTRDMHHIPDSIRTLQLRRDGSHLHTLERRKQR